MKRWMLMLTLCVAVISCGLITPAPDLQTSTPEAPGEFLGDFYCSGHEGGMIAAAGMLSIREDGGVSLEWMYASEPLEGTWRYDAGRGEVVFSAELELSHAMYNDSVDQLEVHLREGVERAHVETGVMYCRKQ